MMGCDAFEGGNKHQAGYRMHVCIDSHPR
uniref:Uncharacterized protein n=1 Tax=mine drainage metagenome TaxID=410659 RepID=E6QU68_9ZZZZ